MFIFSLARCFSGQSLFKVSYTCSRNYSVYDGGCTHTHLSHVHFSVAQFVCAHPDIFMRVTHTHGSSVHKKVFAHVSLISPSRFLPSHVSPVFFAVLARSLRDHCRLRPPRLHQQSHLHDLAVLSRPKSAGHAPLRTCIVKFGFLAKFGLTTGTEPKEFDKITSVDNDTMLINDPNHNFSDFSKTANENTGQFGVPTVFESSVSQRSHDVFCSGSFFYSKKKKKNKKVFSQARERLMGLRWQKPDLPIW